MTQPIQVESNNQEILVCSVLAAVAGWSINRLRGLHFATLTFLLHISWALLMLLFILGNGSLKAVDTVGRVATSIGMPLIAAEACMRANLEQWKAYINLLLPLVDLGAYFTSDVKQLDPQVLLFSKAISIGLLIWIAHRATSNNSTNGYFLAGAWIAAEYYSIHSGKYSAMMYPTLCAVADYCADLYFLNQATA